MALIIGAYWSDTATPYDVVVEAQRLVTADSPETLGDVASLDPDETDVLPPDVLEAVLEDLGVHLTQHHSDVVEVLSLQHATGKFQRGNELDRQAYAAWVAGTYDEPVVDGFAQLFIAFDGIYEERYVQSWGQTDDIEVAINAEFDMCVAQLEDAFVGSLVWLSEPFPEDDDPAVHSGEPSAPGLGPWLAPLADIVSGVVQGILRGL